MNLRGLQKRKSKLESQYDITGKYILLTGRIPKYTRTTIEKKIVELGGILQAKANYNTNIVVFTKTDTTKYRAASHINGSSQGAMLFINGTVFATDFLKLEEL